MERVVIGDKAFVPYICSDTISEAIKRNAAQINECYKGVGVDNAPIFIAILNGSYVYVSDLMREINIPCEVTFIKVASYDGLHSSGAVVDLIGLNYSIAGRDVIVVDDIVDSGVTMKVVCEHLATLEPRSIRVSALIYKSETCCDEVKVDFPCFSLTDSAFIIGYGMDYNEIGRNLKEMYVLER